MHSASGAIQPGVRKLCENHRPKPLKNEDAACWAWLSKAIKNEDAACWVCLTILSCQTRWGDLERCGCLRDEATQTPLCWVTNTAWKCFLIQTHFPAENTSSWKTPTCWEIIPRPFPVLEMLSIWETIPNFKHIQFNAKLVIWGGRLLAFGNDTSGKVYGLFVKYSPLE